MANRNGMTRVCAWCSKDLDTGEPFERPPGVECTHGICDTCVELLRVEPTSLDELLATIDAPIFCVDEDGRVRAANPRACALVGKSLAEITGDLGGDVFQCMYADLPGGCGKTEHCNGCTIRNAVQETLKSGKPAIGRPAFSFHTIEGRTVRREWLITTERRGDAVVFAIRPR